MRRQIAFFVDGHLRGDASLGLFWAAAVSQDGPFDLDGLWDPHKDRRIILHGGSGPRPRFLAFEEEGDVEDNRRRPLFHRTFGSGHHFGDDRGMHQRAEAPPGRRVLEHDVAEGDAVEGSIGSDDGVAERLGDGGEERRAGGLQFMHDRIGINGCGPEFFEDLCDSALSRSNSAGEPDSFRHRGSIAREDGPLKADLSVCPACARGSLNRTAFCIRHSLIVIAVKMLKKGARQSAVWRVTGGFGPGCAQSTGEAGFEARVAFRAPAIQLRLSMAYLRGTGLRFGGPAGALPDPFF